MRGRRDRLIQPGSVHDRVLRQDLDVPVAADIERRRHDEARHDVQRRQPPAVVGPIPAGFGGLDELVRVLNNKGDIDDRTTRGDGGGAGEAPTFAALGPAGTGATVAADAASTDRAGRLTLTTGSAPYGGYVVSVTFAVEREDADFAVLLMPADPDAAAAVALIDIDYTDTTAVRWRIRTAAALTAATLSWWYRVEEFAA